MINFMENKDYSEMLEEVTEAFKPVIPELETLVRELVDGLVPIIKEISKHKDIILKYAEMYYEKHKKEMARKLIYAIDFDGTLCEDKFPDIGAPIEKMVESVKAWAYEGHKIILWTCRKGKELEDAQMWCLERGIVFDAINENLPETFAKYGGNTRKVFADRYVDDKNYSIEE